MEHRYPSRAEWLDKFGYDPKQLSHLLRVSEYLDRYIVGEPYNECLLTKQADYLKAIKRKKINICKKIIYKKENQKRYYIYNIYNIINKI
jgi:hypothetical protein